VARQKRPPLPNGGKNGSGPEKRRGKDNNLGHAFEQYMLHAICYMLYATCYMLHAIHATCYMLHATCYIIFLLYLLCLKSYPPNPSSLTYPYRTGRRRPLGADKALSDSQSR
jgi:hypothetical protein